MAEELNFETIERPYDTLMQRTGGEDVKLGSNGLSSTGSVGLTSSAEEGGTQNSEASQPVIVRAGGELQDVFLQTWIKSMNYTPKVQGFILDAKRGYIECMELYVGAGGIIGGSLDIPNTTAANSWHVDNAGNMWSGATTFASAPFSVTNAGIVVMTSATITGGVLKSSKTSFSDAANAGWYLGPEGIYIGSAADASKLKYSISDGAFDFIGTISNRSTLTIAASIDSTGNLVTDVTNLRLNSATKSILADFDFGSTNYAGAVNSGDIVWDPATGNITSGSGVILYRKGILGVSAGVATFSIDATTGAAVFAGSLSAATGTFAGSLTAASGTLGALTIAAGGHIKMGQSGFNTGSGFFLGDDGGTAKLSIGSGTPDNSVTWDGSVLKVNGTALSNSHIFGSGEDGDATLSGGTTTLTKDMYYDDLTLTSSAVLIPNGYRIFAKGVLTIDAGSAIRWNGNNGTNGNNGSGQVGGTGAGEGGAALTSQSLYGSLAGKKGADGGHGADYGSSSTTGNGAAGTAITACFKTSYSGSGGSSGGGGEAGAIWGPASGGGSSGAAGGTTPSKTRPFCIQFLNPMLEMAAGTGLEYLKFNGNAGSSAGGGGGGGAHGGWGNTYGGGGGQGGGNGSNGGTIIICARNIVNNGSIEAIGGYGGNGGNGAAGQNASSGYTGYGGGGGGGGGAGVGGDGGVIGLVYAGLSGSGTVSVAGGPSGSVGTAGAGGSGVNGGANGFPGTNGSLPTQASVGKIIQLVV